MLHRLPRLLLFAALILTVGASCTLTRSGREKRKSSKVEGSGFLGDYGSLKNGKHLDFVFVDPEIDFRRYRSVQVLNFADQTGGDVQLWAEDYLPEQIARELRRIGTIDLVNRTPELSGAPTTDLIFDGVYTKFEVSDSLSKVEMEGKLYEATSRRVVLAFVEKQTAYGAAVGFENPLKDSFDKVADGIVTTIEDTWY